MTALVPPPATTEETPPSEPQIIDRLMKTVSPSRLTLFLQCRLKWYYRYVARIPKLKSAALHVGTCVHSVLKVQNKARWKGETLTLKQLHDEFSKAWADQTEEPIEWADGEEDEEKKVGWRLVETYLRETKISQILKPDAVEVPVEAELHEQGLPTLIGVLDLVQDGVIIDYKSSGQTPHPERSLHAHEIQTTTYGILYREATGKKENGIEIHTLVKTKSPKLAVISAPPVTDDQQSRLFRQMESYVHGLDVRDFVPSPGIACSFCEFFNECKRWS